MYTVVGKMLPQPQCFRLHPQINFICIHLCCIQLCINMSPSQLPSRLLEAHDKHLQTGLEVQKLCS